MQVYLSERNTFNGIHPHLQQRILTGFLQACRPSACFCDEPCTSPKLSPLLPDKMCLDLRNYSHGYDTETIARLQGAWKCHPSVLDGVYPPVDTTHAGAYKAASVANTFLFGLSEAIYSWNIAGVRVGVELVVSYTAQSNDTSQAEDIVTAATPVLLEVNFSNIG